VKDKNILRIIDVNLNRAKEGLRVCEDVTRFILNDSASTRALKIIRHKIQDIVEYSRIKKDFLCSARDIAGDCGMDFSSLEKKSDWKSILFANMQRVKESLRVLEEFTKLLKDSSCEKFKRLRFRFYAQEKRITEKYFK
jgi:hypothetical protein